MDARPSSGVIAGAAAAGVEDRASRGSGRWKTDLTRSISDGPDADRELVLAEVRRPNATSKAEKTPTQPPDAGIWSGADISSRYSARTVGAGVTGGNSATPPGVIAARRPRPACATAGSVDITTATPNATATAPARSMYLAAPNAFISCQLLRRPRTLLRPRRVGTYGTGIHA
jgi:hypothetical protein